MKNIKIRDKNFIWHPYTKQTKIYDPLVITSAYEDKLVDANGNEYLDLISSWWVNIHGHCKKEIIDSINEQLKRFEQVLFTDFTHEPAVDLAEKLAFLLPGNLNRVFYSDNGSTAVEIAMKVAIQYWYNSGKRRKNKFVSITGGYHGDTFGAMSIGLSSGFYEPFKDVVQKQFFIPFPEFWNGKNDIDSDEKKALNYADQIIANNIDEVAAIIVEPLIHGASGMKMYRKEFLEKLLKKFRDSKILIIFDEVMTGFGRTGKMFASNHIDIQPDIICLAKAITGGYLPLAATVFDERIHENFFGENISKTFLHGHSFTANPVACSAALSSLKIFEEENTLKKVLEISQIHSECLKNIAKKLNISKPRVLGSIAAFDINEIKPIYGSQESEKLKQSFLNEGLLIRPIGNTIYLMPPYCISKESLYESYEKIVKILK